MVLFRNSSLVRGVGPIFDPDVIDEDPEPDDLNSWSKDLSLHRGDVHDQSTGVDHSYPQLLFVPLKFLMISYRSDRN